MSSPNGWLGKDDHRGWRGVTDKLNILIAVSYEPTEGHLCCRFNHGEDLIHVGVPEKCYRAIVNSLFGGSYYRKFVRNQYPCPYAEHPPPYKPKEKPNAKNLPPVKERPDGETPAQASLFLLLEKKAVRRGKRSLNGGINDAD